MLTSACVAWIYDNGLNFLLFLSRKILFLLDFRGFVVDTIHSQWQVKNNVYLRGIRMGRSSETVSFFCADQMQIEEVVAATREKDLSEMNGEYLSSFIGNQRSSLEKFDDGYWICKTEDGNWIEFSTF